MIKSKQDVKDILKLQKNVNCKTYNYFKICEGSSKIIISCPHARNHRREGKIKKADFYTGYIGKIVSYLTGAHLIYVYKDIDVDPNYEQDTLYVTELEDYIKTHNIKFLVDLHGLRRARKKNIEIGTNRGYNINYDNNLLTKVKSIFEETIDNVHVDEQFIADSHTVSGQIKERCGIKTMQIEINGRYRKKKRRPKSFAIINNTLVAVVKFIENYIDK